MVTYNSLLQAEIRSQNRVRVFAGFDMIWQTGRLASQRPRFPPDQPPPEPRAARPRPSDRTKRTA